MRPRFALALLAACAVAALLAGGCAKGAAGEPTDDDDGSSAFGGGGSTSANVGGSSGTCNDGVRDPGEACDQQDLGGQTCQSLGFLAGELSCNPLNCTLDATNCANDQCGNNVLESGEQCDGTNFGNTTCTSLGLAGGTMACDASCMITGCKDHYGEDFEGMGTPVGFMVGGSAPWFVSASSPHMGAGCHESGNIGDSQTSSAYLTLTFDVPGTISFWHRESTESGYDYLQFYIDSSLQQEWDGSSGWVLASFSVAAGTHAFEWRYSKDGSLSSGSDTVWVDDIVTQNGYLP